MGPVLRQHPYQAIIWNNAGILLIEPLGTNFSEILFDLQTFSLKKIRLKMSSAKCSFRLGLNVLFLIPHIRRAADMGVLLHLVVSLSHLLHIANGFSKYASICFSLDNAAFVEDLTIIYTVKFYICSKINIGAYVYTDCDNLKCLYNIWSTLRLECFLYNIPNRYWITSTSKNIVPLFGVRICVVNRFHFAYFSIDSKVIIAHLFDVCYSTQHVLMSRFTNTSSESALLAPTPSKWYIPIIS